MEIGEALRKCVTMSEAKEHQNIPGEINGKLFLSIDPETEAGATVLQWWESSGMWPVEPRKEPITYRTIEEICGELAPKNRNEVAGSRPNFVE